MKQVVDAFGNKIVGLFKRPDGSFIVSDKSSLNRSIAEKSRTDELIHLRDRVARMEELLEKLLQNDVNK